MPYILTRNSQFLTRNSLVRNPPFLVTLENWYTNKFWVFAHSMNSIRQGSDSTTVNQRACKLHWATLIRYSNNSNDFCVDLRLSISRAICSNCWNNVSQNLEAPVFCSISQHYKRTSKQLTLFVTSLVGNKLVWVCYQLLFPQLILFRMRQ